MATKQKNRERKVSAFAAADTAAPRPWTIYQNPAASVSDATAAMRAVFDNDLSLRGMSVFAGIVGTSVKVDIKVSGVIKLTGTVTVATKASYFRPTTPVVVPAGAEVSCDLDVTGTCGGITVILDTVP